MTGIKLLLPATENAPAKVKDEGVVNLAKKGWAAYNAKSGELLFLPEAERQNRELASKICASLFYTAGMQQVGCGSDSAVYSLAERYVREWQDSANLYSDTRGRNIRMLGWSADCEKSEERSAAVRKTLLSLLTETQAEAGFAFAEEISGSAMQNFVLLSPANPGSLGARNGFLCPSCGRAFLPDSPYGYTPLQPGESEKEEILEDIETPGADTILGLCEMLGIDIGYTLKAMLYVAYDDKSAPHPIASFVRGDYNVSMPKLAEWLWDSKGLRGLRTAEKPELQEMIGEVAGYCGPVGLPDNVVTVCDESVRGAKNTVVGANRAGYHRKGCCHGRDFDAPIADIAQISAKIACPCGKGSLEEAMFRECGNVATGLPMPPNEAAEKNRKPLSYRDREGTHEYPYELAGNISVEMIILALHAR